MLLSKQTDHEVLPSKGISKAFGRILFTIAIAAGIFVFGYGIGNGKIVFSRNGLVTTQVKDTDLPTDLDYSSVEAVYDSLKNSYDGDLDKKVLLDGIKSGLASASGDPYTEYLNAEAAQEFSEELSGSFTGIGAELGKDKDAIVIISPISGFPAEKAGLKPKDVVVEIDGESAFDITITEAVKRIRGPKDTKVTLKIIRDSQEQLTFEIIRDNINIPSVESQILEGGIGYLKVSRFADDTASLARKAAQSFKAAKVKGVVLDVRGDPGGLLDVSVDVSSLWLQNKTVLQEKRDGIVVRTFTSRGTPELLGVPTVVLINEGSASASEITAGALKDNGAATLIGTKTYGKGSVQQLQPLEGGGVLKVTIARWFTPNGKNIDKEGISPDQEVERSDDDYKNNRDPQKDAAIQFLGR